MRPAALPCARRCPASHTTSRRCCHGHARAPSRVGVAVQPGEVPPREAQPAALESAEAGPGPGSWHAAHGPQARIVVRSAAGAAKDWAQVASLWCQVRPAPQHTQLCRPTSGLRLASIMPRRMAQALLRSGLTEWLPPESEEEEAALAEQVCSLASVTPTAGNCAAAVRPLQAWPLFVVQVMGQLAQAHARKRQVGLWVVCGWLASALWRQRVKTSRHGRPLTLQAARDARVLRARVKALLSQLRAGGLTGMEVRRELEACARQLRRGTRSRQWACLLAYPATHGDECDAVRPAPVGYLLLCLRQPMAAVPPPLPSSAPHVHYVDALAVAPGWQRQGVGRALLTAAETLTRRCAPALRAATMQLFGRVLCAA
jgi:GNAT superfamily N-acetyltransferase